MSEKRLIIYGNPILFSEWMECKKKAESLGHQVQNMASIIQNEMNIPKSQLTEYKKQLMDFHSDLDQLRKDVDNLFSKTLEEIVYSNEFPF